MAKKPASAWVKPAALGGILLLFIILAGSRLGSIPAPGRFFNPFSGFWRNAEAGGLKGGELRLGGLREPVSVAFDKRAVPHIFAQNAHDLYFAQGFITARDRLWQMEVQTHSAAGRLAEFLGPAFLERDRFQRRLGMLHGAEESLALMKKDAESWDAAQAYAAGVNAYLESLDPARYPVEYKLLGYAPERWTPLKTVLLIRNMQWTLSGGGDDLPMTNTRGKFGPEFMEKFYPVRDPSLDPVIPAGTPWTPVRDTSPAMEYPSLLPGDTSSWPDPSMGPRSIKVPQDSSNQASPAPALPPPPMQAPALPAPARPADTLGESPDPEDTPVPVLPSVPDPGNGSNNFAASGKRTVTGYPILGNDPHLDLGLPSIWYEIQLAAPGLNVYGASLAGAPAVVIGFNRSIAWGMTNGHDDVLDWYRLEFRDSTMAEYLHSGNWRSTRQVVEAIKVRGARTVLDTVIYSHHGPVVLKTQEKPRIRNSPSMHAMRWLANKPSNELQAMMRIMKAGSYGEFAAALEDFHCPAQNFVFASASGDIAMEHQGLFPRKWPGQGRYTLEGSEPGHDWLGWIPMAENPRSRNPEQGWLASANQAPTDTTYPHYLGSRFMMGKRSVRLNQLLSDADSLSAVGAAEILLDGMNLHAAEILPELLRRVTRHGLSPSDSADLQALAAWDHIHRPDQASPALFDLWWRILYRNIWQDEFAADSLRYQWPSKDRTRRLILEEPGEDWFDDITTPNRETLNYLVNRSFRDACTRLHRLGPSPTWAIYRPVEIHHLARLSGFSRLDVATGGCADCVNSQKTSHGPSLRMVVTLGRQGPKAYGIYPGGQSGNPGSKRYDDFIDDWASGKLHELIYLSDLRDRPDQIQVRLLLEGK